MLDRSPKLLDQDLDPGFKPRRGWGWAGDAVFVSGKIYPIRSRRSMAWISKYKSWTKSWLHIELRLIIRPGLDPLYELLWLWGRDLMWILDWISMSYILTVYRPTSYHELSSESWYLHLCVMLLGSYAYKSMPCLILSLANGCRISSAQTQSCIQVPWGTSCAPIYWCLIFCLYPYGVPCSIILG